MFSGLDSQQQEKSPVVRKRRRRPPRFRSLPGNGSFIIKASAGVLDTSRNSQQSSSVSSLKRHLQHPFSSPKKDEDNKENDVVITDERDGGLLSRQGSMASSSAASLDNNNKSDQQSERGIDVGRVASWATDFEKLLADPVGLQTFAEFLKKEFSAENIIFWVSCERFRRSAASSTPEQLHACAMAIVDRHLAQGAPDPVNVDSHARQAAQDGLANPTATLFAAAQKQIYNLMKFDSFSRFLKSDLYKESLMAEMSGRQLPYSDSLDSEVMLDTNAVSTSSSTNDKSNKKNKAVEDATSRRRSLLPWSKDRSKSKERNSNKNSGSSIGSQKMAKEDSRSSIHGVEEAPSGDNCTLARVILPDKATTVVQTRKGETIRAMVARLLEKRGLRLTSFDVFAMEGTEQGRPLDLTDDCSTLGCTEVRVEPRVLFRLELPSSKSIGVKAKPAKVVRDVLGPILQQYGWQLDRVSVRREGRVTSAVDLDSTVASIDNSRLSVTEISGQGSFRGRAHSASGMADEIRSLGSNSSLGSLGERRRQHSATDDEKLAMPPPTLIPNHHQQHQRKIKTGGAQVFGDELYEGLKIAQRGRLEDQRGTEINFEMPDFLKRSQDKENNYPLPHRQSEPIISSQFHLQQQQQQQHHSDRRDIFPAPPNNYERLSYHSNHHPQTPHLQGHYYSQIPEHEYQQPYVLQQQQQQQRRDSFLMRHAANESTFSHDGLVPSAQDADRLFASDAGSSSFLSTESRLSLGFNPRQQTPARGAGRMLPQTPSGDHNFGTPMYETLTNYKTSNAGHVVSAASHRREPPPLPPKPRMSSSSSMPGNMRQSMGSEADLPLPPYDYQHRQQQQQQQQQHHRASGQAKGYNVSFV